MLSPAIRSHQLRPPNGGWSIWYELDGQKWLFEKGGPYGIVESIAEVQQANGRFVSYGHIWDYCNKIWTERDPARALPYTESAGIGNNPPRTVTRITARAIYRAGCSSC